MAPMMLEEALTYLDMGWCVYPAHTIDLATGFCSCGRKDCPGPGKHPIGRWTEYQNRLPTKREVKLWFKNMDCNIGTVTGMVSGIIVVDIDGDEGVATARKLNLQPTLAARTGGGGFHLFYSIDRPVASRVRAMPGIDLRGDGGYVVLAPSIHHSGRRYEWIEPKPLMPFDYTTFKEAKPGFYRDTGWVDEILPGVSEGSRSLSAARLSGRYFGMGLSLEEVWILVSTWNERNDPPLNHDELFRTVNAVGRKHEETCAPIQVQTFGQIMNILNGVKNGRE